MSQNHYWSRRRRAVGGVHFESSRLISTIEIERRGPSQQDSELENLFDEQVRWFRRRFTTLPSALEILESKKGEVLTCFSRFDFRPSEGVCFLPVVPARIRSLDQQLKTLVLVKDGRTGRSLVNLEHLVDLVATPEHPYWLVGVKLGKECASEASLKIRRNMNKRRESSLTVIEAITLCANLRCDFFLKENNPVLRILGSREDQSAKDLGLFCSSSAVTLGFVPDAITNRWHPRCWARV